MGRSAVLQEVRIMRFEDVHGRHARSRSSCEEASSLPAGGLALFADFNAVVGHADLDGYQVNLGGRMNFWAGIPEPAGRLARGG